MKIKAVKHCDSNQHEKIYSTTYVIKKLSFNTKLENNVEKMLCFLEK